MQTSVLKVPLWLKNEQDDDDGQVSSTNGGSSDVGEQCVDIRNDTLIRHMSHKYSRSKESAGEEDPYVRT